jgi:hypothetical protein
VVKVAAEMLTLVAALEVLHTEDIQILVAAEVRVALEVQVMLVVMVDQE